VIRGLVGLKLDCLFVGCRGLIVLLRLGIGIRKVGVNDVLCRIFFRCFLEEADGFVIVFRGESGSSAFEGSLGRIGFGLSSAIFFRSSSLAARLRRPSRFEIKVGLGVPPNDTRTVSFDMSCRLHDSDFCIARRQTRVHFDPCCRS
jgi:hypothetical protein